MMGMVGRLPALTLDTLTKWRKSLVGDVEAKSESGAAPERMVAGGELLRPALWLAGAVLVVVLSALAVIYSAYEYRKLFNRHQVLVQQGDDLQVEWSQLLLEQSAWGANNRVETQARKKLDMVTPEPDSIEIVRHER